MLERQESQAAIYNQNQLPNFVAFCIYSYQTKPTDRDVTPDKQRAVRSKTAANFGQKLEVWQI
jgi:hypothetical protein